MSLNRRQFLILGGLGSLGLLVANKVGLDRFTGSPWSSQVNNINNIFTTSQESSSSITSDGQTIAATESPMFRFVAVADTGTGGSGQYRVAAAMTRYHRQYPFDLVILAGDNIYNNGEIEKINAVFEKPYKPLLDQGVQFRACLGNHDIRTANGDPQVRYPGFNMTGRYYTFARDPVQFFALDTNTNADWEAQQPWLERELSQSTARWKIVFGHHQIYSSGHYGLNEGLIKRLTPVFRKYGVQLYINGHDHHYERSQPIDGTTYLICGAGAGTRPVGHSTWTAYSAQTLSFAAIAVYPDYLLIQGIGTRNQIFDQGIVYRSLVG
ncbi:MAG: metallophosphoesterase [Cyanobacteria bacterium]|nr:metallophosphoesterase [Cyanobacteriota bacterium]MDW8201317.1 metallophosphoesterase [Cyanobacteriota bacterium SKYGB_h_bin112]